MIPYKCHTYSLKSGENLENIFGQAEDLGYYFENKENKKVLGFFPIDGLNLPMSPYTFIYQSFEESTPVYINCGLQIIQKGDLLTIYEAEEFQGLFENKLKKLLLIDKATSAELEKISLRKEREIPTKEDWNERLASIISVLQKENASVSKVVMARKVTYLHNSQDFTKLTKNLFLKLKVNTRNVFKISFPLPGSSVQSFTSFTPERILQSDGKIIELEAIAGTRPRGKTESEDKLLEKELFNSPKDREEHQKVIDLIFKTANKFGDCKTEDTKILKLNGIQHLKTPLRIELKNGSKENDLISLVKELHPTPAVGGTPQKAAKEIILKVEGSRGPYAGLFGILSPEHTEVAVLIRSYKIDDSRLEAYGGAGIVSGSTPEEEWNETQEKLNSFLGDCL